MLPHWRKVMGAENRNEDVGQEGNRSLGKMLEGPVWDTLLARNFANLEAPDGSMKLAGLLNFGLLAGVKK